MNSVKVRIITVVWLIYKLSKYPKVDNIRKRTLSFPQQFQFMHTPIQQQCTCTNVKTTSLSKYHRYSCLLF